MPNGETTLLAKLIFLGAMIATGQILVSQEKITPRLFIGRILLGVPVALMSGVVLIKLGELPELAIIGLASLLGIAGHTAIEAAARRWVNRKGRGHDAQ